MIFLTAFSQSIMVDDYKHKRKPGQFFEEYKYLLASIRNIYPAVTPVLYIYEGYVDILELKQFNENLQVINWKHNFEKDLGIDLNGLKVLADAMDKYNDDIVMLDTDCLVVKNFDEYLNDHSDVTVVTRGKLNWRGYRHDIVFAPAIYKNKNKKAFNSYLRRLYFQAFKHAIKTNDYWANVQATVNKMFIDAGVGTDIFLNERNDVLGIIDIKDSAVKVKVVSQFVLGYPIQDEKYYPETRIIHYKNHSLRRTPGELYKKWK